MSREFDLVGFLHLGFLWGVGFSVDFNPGFGGLVVFVFFTQVWEIGIFS